MSFRKIGMLSLALTVVGTTLGVRAQQAPTDIARRAKSKVQPVYPELARKIGISGTVKLEVVVAPNGSVKEARVIGGHPLLANAALEAVKRWKFEPAAAEIAGIVDFKFEPRQ